MGDSDDPQFMMNKAKKDVIMGTLKLQNNECTYEKLFEAAEAAHCDVLAAALLSLKRAKVVKFDGMMLVRQPVYILQSPASCFRSRP